MNIGRFINSLHSFAFYSNIKRAICLILNSVTYLRAYACLVRLRLLIGWRLGYRNQTSIDQILIQCC